MQKLDVSVVICTRDRNEYLAKCVSSLLKQNYPPKEIIIIDDYSDTNVAKFFAKEFYQLFSNLKMLFNFRTRLILLRNKDHSGIVKSRNLGIKVASGDIIAFLDDDSLAHPNWLKNLAKHYHNQTIVGVGGPVVESRRMKTPQKPIKNLAYIRNGKVISNLRVRKFKEIGYLPRKFVPFLQGGNMSFRRDVLLKISGGDANLVGNSYREETDLCFKVAKMGKIMFEPYAVTYHNTAEKGGSRTIINFQLDRFLYYMFRNTTYFFFKHFDLRKAFSMTMSSFKKQVRLIDENKTGLTRDFLKIHSKRASVFSIIKGCLTGFYCWLKNRTKEVEFIFSQPSTIKTYKLIILGSTIKFLEVENKTKFLKKLLGMS
ncbi:MAG: glycosyltransferase family 2 protein [Candidatus Aenigmarchaeota archaeon]|nr:glycosyltransferase family 2 protein [Candidatus Aenigmarchaeota archaeon]